MFNCAACDLLVWINILQTTAFLCWFSRILTSLTSSIVHGRSTKPGSTTREATSGSGLATTCSVSWHGEAAISWGLTYSHVATAAAGTTPSIGYDAFSYHNGLMFTTIDRDNDRDPSQWCAYWGGGFWFDRCFWCCVNCHNYFFWGRLPGGSHLHSSRMWLQCKWIVNTL